jgi:hypothetical protein
MRRIAVTAVAGSALMLSSCSSANAAPKTSGNVPLKLLSLFGPFSYWGRPPGSLFADTSLVRLRKTVLSTSVVGKQETLPPGCSPFCWPDADAVVGVLYVGAQLQSDACVGLSVIHAELSRTTLRLWADGKNLCAPGARSAAAARLILIDVPLDSLPRKTTLTLDLLTAPGQPPISSAFVALA